MSNSIFRLPRPVILTLALAAILFRPLLLAWPTPFMINNAAYWFGFFAIGYLAGKPLIAIMSDTRRKLAVIAISLIIMLGSIALETWVGGTYIYVATDLKYLAFVIAFMTFFSFFNGKPSLEFLRFYGKNSLIVLGAHLWILVPLERAMFRLTRIHDPLLGLGMAILTAIILITVINTMSRRIPTLVGK